MEDDIFDEDELAEMYEDQMDSMSPEDVFNMVLINKAKKTKVHIVLSDEDGDEVDLVDIISELIEYVKDKLKDEEGNQFADQIMPLMTQSVVSGLGRLVGINATAFYLSNDGMRFSIIQMMCVGFLLLKLIQEKGLVITTYEEEVDDDVIEEIERKSKANSAATLASMIGQDPHEVLKQMYNRGDLTADDLRSMIGDEDETDTDGEEN